MPRLSRALALAALAVLTGVSAAAAQPAPVTNEDCLVCHSDPTLSRASGQTVGVDASVLDRSVHGGLQCVACHVTAGDELPHPEELPPPDCSGCHTDTVGAYFDSIHGRARREAGLVVAPTCGSCHGGHDIQPVSSRESRVHVTNVAATCGTCHAGIERLYKNSIHATALAAGVDTAPSCATCHDPHGLLPTTLAGWELQVVSECGTCHSGLLRTYRDTFHGQVTALGYTLVATCADCHGPHATLPPEDPASMVHPANLITTCGQCHPRAGPSFVQYDPHADRDDPERSPQLYWAARLMHGLLIGVFGFFGVHTALWFTRAWQERREEARRRGR